MDGKIIKFLDTLPLGEKLQKKREFFDSIASSYDSAIIPIVEGAGCPWNRYIEELATLTEEMQNKIIVDVGCGTSFPVGTLLPHNSLYIGVDFSYSMLKHASQLLSDNINVSFFNIDASRIPLEDNSVDMVFAIFLLDDENDYIPVLREIDRILAPQSIFYSVFLEKNGSRDKIKIVGSITGDEIENMLSYFVKKRYTFESRCGNLCFYKVRFY